MLLDQNRLSSNDLYVQFFLSRSEVFLTSAVSSAIFLLFSALHKAWTMVPKFYEVYDQFKSEFGQNFKQNFNITLRFFRNTSNMSAIGLN